MSDPGNTHASQIARPTGPAVAVGFEEPLRSRRRESDHGDLESLLPNFVIEACSLVHALSSINLAYGKEKCLWLHVLDHAFPKSKAALEICKFHSKIMWLWVGASAASSQDYSDASFASAARITEEILGGKRGITSEDAAVEFIPHDDGRSDFGMWQSSDREPTHDGT
jgi:hypothetical protein